MTITPDQARDLLDGIDNTPWRAIKSDFKIDPTGIVRDAEDETIGAAEGGHVDPDFTHGQADLVAAAPDMAETIAGMEVEWGVEHDNMASSPFPRRWTQWYDYETKARNSAAVLADMGKHPVLVRRLVSSPEVIEGE